MQEFIPAYKRGWVSALVTTLLPGGGMLAGLVASWLLPIVGWRYLFLVGLSPLVLVFMIRYWVPESPRWLIRMGRLEEAGRSLAWALMIDPKKITLPPALPALEQTRWLELFKYPRLIAAGGLTGLTQTGGASLGLWGATLLVIVLNITPAHAAFLMVWVGLTGIVGRFFIAAPRRPGGNLIGKPPLPKLSSQRTLRWRVMDSNFRFRVRCKRGIRRKSPASPACGR